MTKAFLVLLFYSGNHVVSSTTMPVPYPYEECRTRGRDFEAINTKAKGWLCVVAPSAE